MIALPQETLLALVPNKDMRALGSPLQTLEKAKGLIRAEEVLVIQYQPEFGQKQYRVVETHSDYETLKQMHEPYMIAICRDKLSVAS